MTNKNGLNMENRVGDNNMKQIEEYKEDVLNCWNVHGLAMLLLISNSGMSIDAICQLDYYNFLLSISKYFFYGSSTSPFYINEIYMQLRSREDIVGHWRLYNTKKDVSYITFSNPKTMHAIMDSLYLRKGSREIDPKEPLFVGRKGDRITKEDVETMFQTYSVGNGPSPNDLREHFVDKLRSAGLPNEKIQYFLGEEGYDPSVSFFLTGNYNDLKSDYEKAFQSSTNELVKLKIPLDQYRYLLDEIRKV